MKCSLIGCYEYRIASGTRLLLIPELITRKKTPKIRKNVRDLTRYNNKHSARAGVLSGLIEKRKNGKSYR